MNLKTYTLSVSLAAIVGLLVTAVPLVRSVFEYRSPQSVNPLAELASIETFISAKEGRPVVRVENMRNLSDWQILYEQAKAQHIQAIRSKAFRDLIAYGVLCALSLVLLITHLRWARRL